MVIPTRLAAALATFALGASACGGGGGQSVEETLEAYALRASDVGEETFALAPGGDSLDRPTLDLCGSNYPSEDDRVARRFVVSGALNVDGNENVAYESADAAARALEEVRESVASCDPGELTPSLLPNIPAYRSDLVLEDVDLPTGVEAIAVTGTLTFESGESVPTATVLMRRGRFVAIVYGSRLAALSDAAGVVAERLAGLPGSDIR